MKHACGESCREQCPVRIMCRLLEIEPDSFYACVAGAQSQAKARTISGMCVSPRVFVRIFRAGLFVPDRSRWSIFVALIANMRIRTLGFDCG